MPRRLAKVESRLITQRQEREAASPDKAGRLCLRESQEKAMAQQARVGQGGVKVAAKVEESEDKRKSL